MDGIFFAAVDASHIGNTTFDKLYKNSETNNDHGD